MSGGEGHEVFGDRLVRRVGDFALEEVRFEVIVGVVLRLQHDLTRGHALAGVDVHVGLVIDAAFEFATLPGQLLGVHRNIL